MLASVSQRMLGMCNKSTTPLGLGFAARNIIPKIALCWQREYLACWQLLVSRRRLAPHFRNSFWLSSHQSSLVPPPATYTVLLRLGRTTASASRGHEGKRVIVIPTLRPREGEHQGREDHLYSPTLTGSRYVYPHCPTP